MKNLPGVVIFKALTGTLNISSAQLSVEDSSSVGEDEADVNFSVFLFFLTLSSFSTLLFA